MTLDAVLLVNELHSFNGETMDSYILQVQQFPKMW